LGRAVSGRKAVSKIDVIIDIECQINSMDAVSRFEAWQRLVLWLVEDLNNWMCAEQGTVGHKLALIIAPKAPPDSYDFCAGNPPFSQRWKAAQSPSRQ
jgi:hypothetical protein